MRLNTLIPDHIVYMSLIGERVAEQKDILKPLPLLGSSAPIPCTPEASYNIGMKSFITLQLTPNFKI